VILLRTNHNAPPILYSLGERTVVLRDYNLGIAVSFVVSEQDTPATIEEKYIDGLNYLYPTAGWKQPSETPEVRPDRAISPNAKKDTSK